MIRAYPLDPRGWGGGGVGAGVNEFFHYEYIFRGAGGGDYGGRG